MLSWLTGSIIAVLIIQSVCLAIAFFISITGYQIESQSILLWFCSAGFILLIGISIGNFFRRSPNAIVISGIALKNPFYDPKLPQELDCETLIKEIKALEEENKKLNNLVGKHKEYNDSLNKANKKLKYVMDIFLRHHNNVSRLIRSLLQLVKEGKSSWLVEFSNNVLDECVTILTKDRANKSSAIYYVNNNQELEMFAYNRIEYISSRERRFKKGEGFVGSIWSKKGRCYNFG